MSAAVEAAGRPAADYAGVTVASLRQGFVLLDGDGAELGPGVVNSDRRGGAHLGTLRERIGVERLYARTGHWPAPELTLPKLLDVAATAPDLWAAARQLLFVHDWALWRMSGRAVTEVSYACAGQMADVGGRAWADVLDELGLGTGRLAPLVEPTTVVGALVDAGLGLPLGIPVISGGGDAQVAAMGAGGMGEGTACVVAGSTTQLQATVGTFPVDPVRHPWVSTHLRPDLWVAETNAGYAGMNFGWLAATTGRSTADLAGPCPPERPRRPGHHRHRRRPGVERGVVGDQGAEDPRGLHHCPRHGRRGPAFVEAHAYAVRANLDDLERAVGLGPEHRREPFERVLVTGGAARSPDFRQLLADVCGRVIVVPDLRDSAAAGGTALVARALGADHRPPPTTVEVEPTASDATRRDTAATWPSSRPCRPISRPRPTAPGE